MKVLQINSVCGVGSTGKIAVGLYNVITENGHQCKIAYGRGNARGVHSGNAIRIGNELGVKLHALGTRIMDRHGYFSTAATKKLIYEIKEYNPDIIHLHNIHGYYVNIEILFNYIILSEKPVVWTLHDCWPFTGHCAYFTWDNCEKWKDMCENCRRCKAYPASVISNSKNNYIKKRDLFTKVNKMMFVTPSQWLADLVKESFLGKYPVKTIYNGIDTNIFKCTQGCFRKKYDIGEKKLILGVANIWDERKGLKDMIELSGLLDAETYQVVVVGVNDKQYRELPERIIGIKRTDTQEELVQIYSEADVFINPTYEDNFPTVNLEALACGTPVITYNTGGSQEAIDESCGIVTEEKTPAALKKAIEEMENKSIKSSDCLQRSQLFDQQARFKDYIELYKKMVQN